MQPIRRLLLIMLCLSWAAASTHAQRMPQDSWYFSHKWGSSGSGDGQFSTYLKGISVTPEGLVFVADTSNYRIQVFDRDGGFVRKWGSQGDGDGLFREPSGIAISSDGLVYVANSSSSYFNGIQVFNQDGTFVRKWGSSGSGDSQFNNPSDVDVSPEGLVFVADSYNHRIQVFSEDGTFIRKWGSNGSVDGQFNWPLGITVGPAGQVFVADHSNNRIQVFDQNGAFVRKWSVSAPVDVVVMSAGLVLVGSGRNYTSIEIFEPDGTLLRSIHNHGAERRIAVSADGTIYAAESYNSYSIKVFKPAGYRLTPRFGDVPLPQIANVSQRPGTPYLDVDYVVWDGDSTNVTVAAAAFEDGIDSLNNFIKVSSFVDGTESSVGSNVFANVTNRFTWNVAADWQAEYVNLKVRVMAQDDRGLMSISFLNLPEDAEYSLPALTISQSPITQSDMLPLWYWLLATGDESVELNGGAVYGVGGAYDGIMLSQGITTTADGRLFLFEKIGVRQATAAEITRAKTGPAGVVNQWTPRITVGPGDRPKRVNEYGFDTGDWGTDGWWVVKEP